MVNIAAQVVVEIKPASIAGPKGEGIPDGGTPGQVLTKTDGGAEWADSPAVGKVDKMQGAENAGKLLFVGADGNVTVVALGAGLSIVDGVLTVTGAAVESGVEFVVTDDGAVMLSNVEFVTQDDGSVMLAGATFSADDDGYVTINGGA